MSAKKSENQTVEIKFLTLDRCASYKTLTIKYAL